MVFRNNDRYKRIGMNIESSISHTNMRLRKEGLAVMVIGSKQVAKNNVMKIPAVYAVL